MGWKKGGGARSSGGDLPSASSVPCGILAGDGLYPLGPALMLTPFPRPALTGHRTPRLPVAVAVPVVRPGHLALVAATASHACLWPWIPAPPTIASACRSGDVQPQPVGDTAAVGWPKCVPSGSNRQLLGPGVAIRGKKKKLKVSNTPYLTKGPALRDTHNTMWAPHQLLKCPHPLCVSFSRNVFG